MLKFNSPSYCTLCMRLLPIMLLVLTACAPGVVSTPQLDGADAPEPVVEEQVEAVAEIPLRGVVITETANLDSAARADFAEAVALLLAADIDGAILLLEPLVAADPQVTAPYIDLAIAYRKKAQPEPAEAMLKKALQLIPGHPVASNEYGLLLRAAGRFGEAREVYSSALERYPDYLPLRLNLGILCDLYQNDGECALEQYRYYSEARPEDEQAALWLTELQMRIGQ